MLNCKQVLAELSNYLDDEVSPQVRRAMEAHLSRCVRCTVIFDTARKTLRIVSDVGAFEIPLALSERLRVKLRELYAAT